MARSVRVQAGAALLAARAGPAAETRRLMARAARTTLRTQQVSDAEISITLLDDAEIGTLNAEFLSHDGPTDVISFPLYEQGEDPVGDIYIGYEQALRQARTNEVGPAEELVRLAVHGVLHVLGYDHPAGVQRLRSPMWQVQESIIAQVLAP